MIDLEKLIEKEVEKQMINRHIASKSWVRKAIASYPRYDAKEAITSLQKQTRKLFAEIDEIKEKKEIPERPEKDLLSERLRAVTMGLEVILSDYELRILNKAIDCITTVEKQ